MERDIGPDPHLNGRGVVLSRAQRGRLLRIGFVIGGVLVLAAVGLGSVLP